MFHLRASKVCVAPCSRCFTQDIPSHFSPYVIPSIHHFLQRCAKTWQDRQMSALGELMGRELRRLAEMWQDSQTSTKRLRGQSASNMAESCRDDKSAVLMRAGARGDRRGVCVCVCVCVICHQNRCLCCLSFWCRPTSTVFLDGGWRRFDTFPTKRWAAGGQAHVLLLACSRLEKLLFYLLFSFIFLLRKKVGSKVSESLVFFPLLFFFLESIWNFPGVIAALTHSRSINKQKVGTVVLLSSVQITVESHLSAASGNRELRLVHSFKYSHMRLQADCKPFGEHLSFRSESALVYSAWGPAGKSPRLMQFYVQAIWKHNNATLLILLSNFLTQFISSALMFMS